MVGAGNWCCLRMRMESRASNVSLVRPTEPFRREHAELLEHIEHLAVAAREMPGLSEVERDSLRGRILSFLQGTLIPHARAEETVLYPEWAELVGFADAAMPMVHDHETIVAWIEELASASVSDVDRLQELLYGLYALISVHFRKEEDLQLPVFDSHPEAAERVLARMGESGGETHAHQH
jgi:hypothetical protein